MNGDHSKEYLGVLIFNVIYMYMPGRYHFSFIPNGYFFIGSIYYFKECLGTKSKVLDLFKTNAPYS